MLRHFGQRDLFVLVPNKTVSASISKFALSRQRRRGQQLILSKSTLP